MSGLLNAGLAFVLLHARRLDHCIEQVRTAIEVDPTMVLSYWTLGLALEQKRDYAQALDAYHKSIEIGSAPGFPTAFLVHAYARSGQVGQARVYLRELDELSKARYVPSMAFVIAYEGLREIDLALGAIEKSCDLRESDLILIKVWHHFDALRDQPRFHAVERRVGLRQ
jgi:tetratricopeptide (TPR) repeat protein